MPKPPTPPSPTPAPLSVHQIADRIAAVRGKCNYTSVYRVIGRLKMKPYTTNGAFKFYTEEQARQIAAALRSPNKKAPAKVAP